MPTNSIVDGSASVRFMSHMTAGQLSGCPCKTGMTHKSKNNIKTVTFGCRLNTYETEVMKRHAQEAGLDNIVIVNTCAVTGEAERKSRQAVRRARRENPDARVIVTGCAVQVNPDIFAAMPEVDQLIGNDLKLKADVWRAPLSKRVQVNDIMLVSETAGYMVSGFEGYTRAFVQVQNGCDHRCTFCIIPYGRGSSRSVAMEDIVGQVRELVAGGYREIVLTGVDITSYGADLPEHPTLGQMIRRLLELAPEIKRLRLSSLDPAGIDKDLWGLIADEPRLMPHLHLSMQSGDDMILKRMKRRHTRRDLLDVCERARRLRPDIVFGADIIAGFPTETEEMFENTLSAVRECGLTFLHVFPYSSRSGTPAARMPQVEGNVRKERAKRLRELGIGQLNSHLESLVGKSLSVLIEENNKGRTEYFSEVIIDHNLPSGQIVTVMMESEAGNYLRGEVVL